MEVILAVLTGLTFSAAIYLLLSPHLIRFIFGLAILSNAINLLMFTAGRITSIEIPIVPKGHEAPVIQTANPLSQALILTAIVINFALLSYTLVLAYRTSLQMHTVETDDIILADKEKDSKE